MGFFKAVSVRLKTTIRSTDLLEVMSRDCDDDIKMFLLKHENISLFSIDKNKSWPNIFFQLIWGQLSLEYAKKRKPLDSIDTIIVMQAVGYALSQKYPHDEDVQQWVAQLPVGV